MIMKHFFLYFTIFITISIVSFATFSLAATEAHLLTSAQQNFEQGKFALAIEQWKDFLNTPPSNSSQRLGVLINLARTYQLLGFATKSLDFLTEALPLAQNNPIRRSLILGMLSNLYYLRRHDLDKNDTQKSTEEMAEDYAQQSVELVCHPVQSPLACATALNYQGGLLYKQGKDSEALGKYKESLKYAQQADDPVLSAKLQTNILQLDFNLKDLDDALSKMQSLPNSHDKVFGLLKLGALAIEHLGEHSQLKMRAYHILRQAWELARQLGDKKGEAYAYGYLGKLYEKNGRYQEAEQLTRQAIILTGQGYLPEMLYLWQWQLGRLRKVQGDLEGAIVAYQSAVDNLQTIRHAIAQESSRLSSQSNLKKSDLVYLELADLWLQSARRAPLAKVRQDALRQARNTLELLKQVELENYFQDDCVIKLEKNAVAIDTLIDEKTAVLYPVIFPGDRVTLLLSFSHQMIVENVDAKTVLTNRQLREVVTGLNSNEQLRKSSGNASIIKNNVQALYQVFIAPIRHQLEKQNIQTLVIVPDKLLHQIPFATLYDGKSKQFLVEQYALAVTPGLTLTDVEPINWDDVDVLAGGLSKSASPLPQVSQFLKTIHEIYLNRTTQLLDDTFTIATVKKLLQVTPYNMVLFATHGYFGRTPQRTFLSTYDGKLTLDLMGTLMRQTRFREKPIELLTLVACQTAAGDEEAALGLAGVTVKAGAKSAVASLWFVEPQLTMELIANFHRTLANNRTLAENNRLNKAQALQQAQIALIHKLREDNRAHPYYWAAFLLIGNWF